MNGFRWDPAQYMKFGGERLRPALELLGRVPLEAPAKVVDLGCGTGNVTRLLAECWPGASVTGVDSSAEMLAEARKQADGIDWIEADIARWTPPAPVNLLFSNAVLHWLDNHAGLFSRLTDLVAPGGVLAVQMPRNFGDPSHTEIMDLALSGRWRDRLEGLVRPWPVAEPGVYYDLLARRASEVDIWETIYTQVFDGDDPVVEWVRSTALKPFLDVLDGEEQAAFLAEYTTRMRRAYPKRKDGITLYPFRRLFIVARL